jgi:sugar lactone lactonase YvrE
MKAQFAFPTNKRLVSLLKRLALAPALWSVAAAAILSGTGKTSVAATLPPTATTLSVASGLNPVSTVASGTVLTLTASVQAGSTAVLAGQVNFCDASVNYCTDIHLLGTAQLTRAGTAIFRFRPGIGNHSYKAVFAGTNAYAGSSSAATPLVVTGTIGPLASTTSLNETGSWGNYALTATVTESGSTVAPSGAVSFLDTSNGNAALNTLPLGPAVAGIDWPLPQTLPTGGTTRAVALGDFNGDGITDLALVTGSPLQPLTIMLGSANGTYTTAPLLSFDAYNLGPMMVADLNGDGLQDLAVLNGDSNTVTVLLGNGDGTFQVAPSSPSIGANPRQMAVADFNGDGIPDLAVTNLSANPLNILLGNGDGTFTATANSPAMSGTPWTIAAGDFNGDGKQDMAITDLYADTVSILLGNGDGTFAVSTSLHSGSKGAPVATADFNGDGKLDLAVGVSGASDSVTILVGNGDGTFNAPAAGPAVISTPISSTQVGDFNGDGIPDVAITDSAVGTFTVFLTNPNGAPTVFSGNAPASPLYELLSAVGDLNGDGRSDLEIGEQDGPSALYVTQPTETTTVTSNVSLVGVGQHLVDASYSGDGNFQASLSGTLPLWGVASATTTTLTVSSGATPITSVAPGTLVALSATVATGATPVTSGQVNFCDASASECTDIHLLGTATLASNGTATYHFVPGAGVHSYKAVFVQDGYGLSSASAAATLTVGPAKQPTYTDTTAITYSGPSGEYTFTGTVVGYGGTAAPTGNISFLDTSFSNTSLATAPLGAATAGLGWLVSQTPTLASSQATQVTGDFNGDGIPDLALLSSTGSVPATATVTITILFGKGDGTFTAGPTTPTTIVGELNYPMVATDLNGDGKMDLAILSYSVSQFENVATFLGNGDGTFAAPVSVTFNQTVNGGDLIPGSLIAADFNGDGKIDLATVGNYVNLGGVTILLGNGDGTLTLKGTNLLPAQGFGLVASGDFNGDGIPDLIATVYYGPHNAFVFLGKGDGTFVATSQFPLQDFTSSLVVGDFNQDGKVDVAIGYASSVEVLLGNGDGTFNQAPGSPLTGAGLSLLAGDFNHDGKVDLAGLDNYYYVIDLYLGGGNGTFTPVSTTPVLNEYTYTPFSLVSADFNEDGVSDLAMLTGHAVTASILLTEPTQTATATVNGITPVGAGTHNVVASYAGDSNYGATVSSPVAVGAALAPVTFSPAPGTYSSAQTVTLSETVPGAAIFYWLSGTVNSNGFVPYTGPISLAMGGAETIQAYASETGYQGSSSTTANYYLNLPTLPPPVFSPAGGSYAGAQTVTITDSVAGATIYYSTGGSTPTASSTKYAGALTVGASGTVSAIAVANGYTASAPASAQYLISSSRSSFIYTIAGNGSAGYSGDGGPATAAQLNSPTASVVDAAGNLYLADQNNNVVRRVAAGTGVVTTFAGNGTGGYTGDSGPATSAQLHYPSGLALDSAGNLYIADTGNYVVREVAMATGVITTIAGTGTFGFSGDGGPAISAQFAGPTAVAFDGAGNLYVADQSNSRIRQVAAKTGVITTVAGSQQSGYSGDGGPATSAQLNLPNGVAADSAGNLYIADSFNNVIRKVNASNGIISTVAGNGYGASQVGAYTGGYTGDGGPATSAELYLPEAVTLDSLGNLYIADYDNQVIRMVTANTGIISTVAGNGSACKSQGGDGGPATSAGFCYPQGITADSLGNLYIADTGDNRIREAYVSSLPPTAPTAAPAFSVAGGTYAAPQTVTITDSTPGAAIYVTLDGSTPNTAGYGYLGPVTVSSDLTIKAIAAAPGHVTSVPVTAAYTITAQPSDVIATVAGDGVAGFFDGGGKPASAQFGSLAAVAIDRSGNLFLADRTNNVVWEVMAKTGQLSIVAGIGPARIGTAGTGNNAGLATNVQLNAPSGVAVDSTGNLYIADTGNNLVRKVAAGTGLITTYAGTGQGNSTTAVGDGGPATSAQLLQPSGLAVDAAGNLYIADPGDSLVRMVSASTGIITSVAGDGTSGSTAAGDGGPATSAGVEGALALALDGNGNLYIATANPTVVRKVTLSTGIITTVAGNGNYYGSSGDGGLATKAEVYPHGLAVDSAGNLYIADTAAIRKVSVSTGVISTVAGTGYVGFSGDGGAATDAQIAQPQGIAFDAAGDLYIADQGNHRVREVFASTHTLLTPTVTLTPSATTISSAQALTVTVTVSGAGATPTGSVTLASGSYLAQQSLANGTITFALTAGSLPVGANTLTATYAPDDASAGAYQTASQSATVTVTSPTGLAAATVTVTPSATNITNDQAITAAISVTGGSGQAMPTGTITLTSGSYSSQQALVSGTASFPLPAGTLTAAANTLTATYGGDPNYAPATGTATIDVVPVVLAVTAPSAVEPGSSATATATLSAGSTYAGTMNLTCALTASPLAAQSVPTCTVAPASVVIAAGGNATATVTVHTTAASSGSALGQPGRPAWQLWGGGGGLMLALLFGVPARRRRMATMMMVLVYGFAALIGCGGGGGSGSVSPPGTPATTAGSYTFSVVGTDASNPKATASANLTITVQ